MPLLRSLRAHLSWLRSTQTVLPNAKALPTPIQEAVDWRTITDIIGVPAPAIVF